MGSSAWANRVPGRIYSGTRLSIDGFRLLRYSFKGMYEDFHATDRWTGQKLHCIYQALIVAIATRHADAVDVKFLASGRPVWIALPHPTWVEYNKRTGRVITDPLAIQTAGHFLKSAIESGTYEHGREMYTLTVDEALGHLNAVLKEVGAPQNALIKTA